MKKVISIILFVFAISLSGVVFPDGRERSLTPKDKQECKKVAGIAAGIQATRNQGHKLYKFYFDLDMVANQYKIDKDSLWILVKEIYLRTDKDERPAVIYNKMVESCGKWVYNSKPIVEYDS
jgi:lipoate-protein ligase A